MKNDISADLLEKFESIKPHLKKWGEEVDFHLLRTILPQVEGINSIQINPTYRIKENKSFISKALYRQRVVPYKNPLIDIEDKVGTRVVVLKSDIIDKISKLICADDFWSSVVTKDVTQEISDNPAQFEYQSLHIIVSPKFESSLFEGCDIKMLTCEIQVRTLLQHSFAEISHDNVYKGPYKHDKQILRNLSKSMALMEATDDYYCSIYNLMTDESRKYSSYHNDLIKRFSQIKTDEWYEKIDPKIADDIFTLLKLNWIEIDDLDVFIKDYELQIRSVISINNDVLFSQPEILLIIYYLFNHRNFLKENWIFDLEVLKFIFQSFSISFENY